MCSSVFCSQVYDQSTSLTSFYLLQTLQLHEITAIPHEIVSSIKCLLILYRF